MRVYKSSIWVFAALLFVVFMVPATGDTKPKKHLPTPITVGETPDIEYINDEIDAALEMLPKGRPYQILKIVIEALNDKIDAQAAQVNGEIEALRKDLDTLKETVDSLNPDGTLRADVDALKEEVINLDGRVDALEGPQTP